MKGPVLGRNMVLRASISMAVLQPARFDGIRGKATVLGSS